ncbi:transposase [Candidatus Cardinium hertigii]|uniref:transposase n=1 Tax=Candidatus Cardinium hertigii TaxID=247481 RepID=UPI003D7C926C
MHKNYPSIKIIQYNGPKKLDKEWFKMFPILIVLLFQNGFYQMGRKKVRKFSSLEKTKIVLDLLKEALTLVELSSKYGVTTKTLQNWKHQFMENASIFLMYKSCMLKAT